MRADRLHSPASAAGGGLMNPTRTFSRATCRRASHNHHQRPHAMRNTRQTAMSARHEQLIEHYRQLVGRHIGDWTVTAVERSEYGGRLRTVATIKCHCGSELKKAPTELLRGDVCKCDSCGSGALAADFDLLGTKAGKRQLLSIVMPTQGIKHRCFRCLCDCGRIDLVQTSTIRQGRGSSCMSCAA
jgi:hypothetical protein